MKAFCPTCGLLLDGETCPRCIEAQTPNEQIWFAGKPDYAIMSDSDNWGYCVVCGLLTSWEYHYKSVCEDCDHAYDKLRSVNHEQKEGQEKG